MNKMLSFTDLDISPIKSDLDLMQEDISQAINTLNLQPSSSERNARIARFQNAHHAIEGAIRFADILSLPILESALDSITQDDLDAVDAMDSAPNSISSRINNALAFFRKAENTPAIDSDNATVIAQVMSALSSDNKIEDPEAFEKTTDIAYDAIANALNGLTIPDTQEIETETAVEAKVETAPEAQLNTEVQALAFDAVSDALSDLLEPKPSDPLPNLESIVNQFIETPEKPDAAVQSAQDPHEIDAINVVKKLWAEPEQTELSQEQKTLLLTLELAITDGLRNGLAKQPDRELIAQERGFKLNAAQIDRAIKTITTPKDNAESTALPLAKIITDIIASGSAQDQADFATLANETIKNDSPDWPELEFIRALELSVLQMAHNSNLKISTTQLLNITVRAKALELINAKKLTSANTTLELVIDTTEKALISTTDNLLVLQNALENSPLKKAGQSLFNAIKQDIRKHAVAIDKQDKNVPIEYAYNASRQTRSLHDAVLQRTDDFIAKNNVNDPVILNAIITLQDKDFLASQALRLLASDVADNFIRDTNLAALNEQQILTATQLIKEKLPETNAMPLRSDKTIQAAVNGTLARLLQQPNGADLIKHIATRPADELENALAIELEQQSLFAHNNHKPLNIKDQEALLKLSDEAAKHEEKQRRLDTKAQAKAAGRARRAALLSSVSHNTISIAKKWYDQAMSNVKSSFILAQGLASKLKTQTPELEDAARDLSLIEDGLAQATPHMADIVANNASYAENMVALHDVHNQVLAPNADAELVDIVIENADRISTAVAEKNTPESENVVALFKDHKNVLTRIKDTLVQSNLALNLRVSSSGTIDIVKTIAANHALKTMPTAARPNTMFITDASHTMTLSGAELAMPDISQQVDDAIKAQASTQAETSIHDDMHLNASLLVNRLVALHTHISSDDYLDKVSDISQSLNKVLTNLGPNGMDILRSISHASIANTQEDLNKIILNASRNTTDKLAKIELSELQLVSTQLFNDMREFNLDTNKQMLAESCKDITTQRLSAMSIDASPELIDGTSKILFDTVLSQREPFSTRIDLYLNLLDTQTTGSIDTIIGYARTAYLAQSEGKTNAANAQIKQLNNALNKLSTAPNSYLRKTVDNGMKLASDTLAKINKPAGKLKFGESLKFGFIGKNAKAVESSGNKDTLIRVSNLVPQKQREWMEKSAKIIAKAAPTVIFGFATGLGVKTLAGLAVAPIGAAGLPVLVAPAIIATVAVAGLAGGAVMGVVGSRLTKAFGEAYEANRSDVNNPIINFAKSAAQTVTSGSVWKDSLSDIASMRRALGNTAKTFIQGHKSFKDSNPQGNIAKNPIAYFKSMMAAAGDLPEGQKDDFRIGLATLTGGLAGLIGASALTNNMVNLNLDTAAPAGAVSIPDAVMPVEVNSDVTGDTIATTLSAPQIDDAALAPTSDSAASGFTPPPVPEVTTIDTISTQVAEPTVSEPASTPAVNNEMPVQVTSAMLDDTVPSDFILPQVNSDAYSTNIDVQTEGFKAAEPVASAEPDATTAPVIAEAPEAPAQAEQTTSEPAPTSAVNDEMPVQVTSDMLSDQVPADMTLPAVDANATSPSVDNAATGFTPLETTPADKFNDIATPAQSEAVQPTREQVLADANDIQQTEPNNTRLSNEELVKQLSEITTNTGKVSLFVENTQSFQDTVAYINEMRDSGVLTGKNLEWFETRIARAENGSFTALNDLRAGIYNGTIFENGKAIKGAIPNMPVNHELGMRLMEDIKSTLGQTEFSKKGFVTALAQNETHLNEVLNGTSKPSIPMPRPRPPGL